MTKESIYLIVFSLPVYQLIFYTVQLISFKRKNPSKKYLGLLLLSMTTFLIINAVHFLGYTETFSYLFIIYLPVLLSIAPAYFLYILSITRENHDVNKSQRLILFSPALLMLIANIIILSIIDTSSRSALYDPNLFSQKVEGSQVPGIWIGMWISAVLLVFGQLFFAIAKVSKIMEQEADIMRKQPSHLAYLEWRWVLGISASVLIFLVINVLIEMVMPVKYLGIIIVYNLLMLVSGGIVGYLGMKQDDLLNQVEKINPASRITGISTEIASNELFNESNTTVLTSNAEARKIRELITNYLETEKPWLKSEFSMYDLCNHLNISRRKISYVLNEVIQKNFYSVVNEYRIKEAEELLSKDEHHLVKMEVLGEMVGFQSKSSFNACFKKVTGMTPSEYKIKKRSDQPPYPNGNSQ